MKVDIQVTIVPSDETMLPELLEHLREFREATDVMPYTNNEERGVYAFIPGVIDVTKIARHIREASGVNRVQIIMVNAR